MEIKVPQTINDAPLERLAAWARYTAEMGDLKDFAEKIEFRVEVVSIFSGVSKAELNRVSYRDLNRAFIHCIEMITAYEPSEPIGVIQTDEKQYIFDKEIHNISTAQVIDIKLIEDIYKEPYRTMSTLYIEEGMIYNEEDKAKRILNPAPDREEVFRNEPIGEEFLNLLSFFLSDYILLKAATLGGNTKRTKKILRKAAKTIASGTTGQQT